MHLPVPRPHWPWLVVALLCAACAARAPGTATDAAAVSDSALADARVTDAAHDATQTATLPTTDHNALLLLQKARAASALAAQAWPAGSAAIWPKFNLHDRPLYLVALDAKDDAVRGYLVHWPSQPKGAFPLQDSAIQQGTFRYDAGLDADDLFDDDPLVAGQHALVLTFPALGITDQAAWLHDTGVATMQRIQRVDVPWQPVTACGVTTYPREQDAIALLFLECAVLKDAVVATEPKVIEQRLREWYVIRTTYADAVPVLRKRFHHYDNLFGSQEFAAARLLRNAGVLTPAQYVARLQGWLDAPFAAPLGQFDDLMLNNGAIGAVALDLATRLGWDDEPSYRKTGTVYYEVPVHLGGEPTAALLGEAKQRYDWAAFQARAALYAEP